MKTNTKLAPQGYLSAVREHRNKQTRRIAYGVAAFLLILGTVLSSTSYGQALLSASVFAQETYDAEDEFYNEEDEYDAIAEEGCNVLGISLYGEIMTYYGSANEYTSANSVRIALDEYANHENIKAILIDVDSGGGSPVGGDEMLKMFEDQPIPVVAQVRELGASAAYLAILSADRIFAHEYSSVGSIGVIYSHYDETNKNKKDGIKYQPILSAPGKDIGSPDRPMTDSERKRMQEEIDYIFDGFVDSVAKYRNLSREAVLAAADGTTYLAPVALKLGLIDEVGGIREVKSYLRGEIGEEPVVCWMNETLY